MTKFYIVMNEKEKKIFYEYRPLSEIMKDLPDNFVRCSSSVVVNRDYVYMYTHQMITMKDGREVKIGRKYSDVMKSKLLNLK